MILALRKDGLDPYWMRIETAGQLRAALENDRWDAVLSDFTLPEFGAAAALDIVRAVDLDIPFIVVSGTVGEDVAVALVRAGANDYVVKDRLTRLGVVVERELREADNRRAERRSDSVAAHLMAVVESSDDAIFSESLDGLVTTWNPAAERLFGIPAREAIGRDTLFIVPEDKVDEMAQIVERVLRGEHVQHFETRRLHRNGTRLAVSITISAIRDTHGQVTGISKVVRDISQQLLLQQELRNRLQQQVVVAELGRFALRSADLNLLMQEATRVIAETSGTELSSVMKLLPGGKSLKLWAGVGWINGVVDRVTVSAENGSAEAHILTSNTPVLVQDLPNDARFKVPELLQEHGVVSSLSVVIHGRERPLGILGVYATKRRHFSSDDMSFLVSISNLLAAAIENKETENALRASDEQFRAFMDNSPASSFIQDEEGRYLYVNPTWYQQFKTHPLDWQGKTDDEFWPRETAVMFRASSKKCLLLNTAIQLEETAWTKSGDERTWLVMKFPIIEGDKRRVGGIAWDITSRKQTEDALRLRDRALAVATEGLVISDAGHPEIPIVYVSPGFERLTGYIAEEVLGRNCRFLQGVDTDPAAVDQLRKAIKAGERCSIELLNYRKDGTTFWNGLSISPVKNAAGLLTHFVGVQSDVTSRRKLEAQLRQSQKMDAFGQLAGGVAHDFNNLLTVINGYSGLLLDVMLQGDPSRDMIAEIYAAGERSAGLTRQLLAFSRQQIFTVKILNLNEIVIEIDKLLRRLIGEDVHLTLTLDTALWMVLADAGQIEQVLLNLAVNARDAMPHGGQLTIETRNIDLDENHVRKYADAHTGPHVQISVTDTGCGMSPDIVARVFEPFFTTKAPGKGTGLGLATVYGIVKQSGGHIGIHSEVGVGTTFKVYLPQAAHAVVEATLQSKAPIAPRGTETILLVEDEDAVRILTRRILVSYGYTVLEAAEGDQAVRMASDYDGPINLLITDVVMPGLGGRAVSEQISALYPGILVLFLSGYTDDAVIRHGVLREGMNFLSKPFSPFALAEKVRRILDKRSDNGDA